MRLERISLCVLMLTAAVGCGGREPEQAKNNTTPEPERPKSAAGPGLLWKVSSPANTIYLVGSIHIGKKEYYPLPAEVEAAFAECQKLVVELDPNKVDQAAVAKIIATHGAYPKGQTLTSTLSKPTRALLEAHLAAKGLKLATFNHLRPWTVAMLLSVQEIMALGWSDAYSLDKHFCAQAGAANKPIIELETADAQVRLFSSLSPELQEQMLAKTVTDLHELKEMLDLTWAVWYAGEHQRLDELLRRTIKEHPEFEPFMKKTFDDRNVEMLKKIETFLAQEERYFVLVGAGHLVGDKGIVRLLERKNYKVEQVRGAVEKQKKAA